MPGSTKQKEFLIGTTGKEGLGIVVNFRLFTPQGALAAAPAVSLVRKMCMIFIALAQRNLITTLTNTKIFVGCTLNSQPLIPCRYMLTTIVPRVFTADLSGHP